MKYFSLSLLVITLTSGCTPGGPLAAGPVYKVNIEGKSYDVQKMAGNENAWAANNSNLWGGFINPEEYLRNVKAIEKVSGCKVVRETITNKGMNTSAAVDCKKSI